MAVKKVKNGRKPVRKVSKKKKKSIRRTIQPETSLVPLKTLQPVRRIGILTGGGDCPGLNAVIRALVKTAIFDYGIDCFGIEDGFHGLIYRRARKLNPLDVSGIIDKGGTILGSSNKDNPFAHRMKINGEEMVVDVSDECIEFIQEMGWDCLVCIGGDGTLTMASQLADKGVNVIGVPKTIDNDLSATERTFGFATAVQTATEAIDRLHTTAMSHHRVQIVEMMGRYAGHLTLHAGVAGGGDIILIPEIPYDIDVVCQVCLSRSRKGKKFSIIAVSEGAKPKGGEMVIQKMVDNSHDPVRLGGIGHVLAEEIGRRTGLEARATVLGHLQRGGSPEAIDRILSTHFGHRAAVLAAERNFTRMVAYQQGRITDVPLHEAIHQLKFVDTESDLIKAARAVGTSFGDTL